MHISWGFYVDSMLLLFLNFQVSASVLAGIDKHASGDQLRDPAILPQHPSFQGSHRSPHMSFRPADVMMKRNDEQRDDLWVRRIDIVTGSIPYGAAAPFLEYFYKTILFNALEFWYTRPPQPILRITMGQLQLTMRVMLDNDGAQGIPWAFVRNFARNMLTMTAMGFTGTYNMWYMTPFNPHLRNLAVQVDLRILWDI